MKQPTNPQDMVALLIEQDKQLKSQDEQIRTLKQALLRLEQKVSMINTSTAQTKGEVLRLQERLRIVSK